MEEININGLIALSEENRRKRSLGVVRERKRKTMNVAWLTSDYGMTA